MFKRFYTDPSFLFLLGINIYCIIYYHNNPSEFGSIVWLYWAQSVLIGIFNFADMRTAKNYDLSGIKMNDVPLTNNEKGKGCASWFFLFHFQFFHFVYFIFLIAALKYKVDFHFLLLGIVAFSLNLIIQFIQHKRMEKDYTVNMGQMMFLPYLRIIPMHLMILGPAFFHWKETDIFLVLKTFADVLMFVIATPYKKIQTTDTTI